MNLQRNRLFALAIANQGNPKSFYVFLEDFTQLVHGDTFFTGELKSSATKVQTQIDSWLQTADGILHKRIIDFQQDFELCLRFVKNLPKKINKFWQKKLRPWYRYARNLVAQKATLGCCLVAIDCLDMEKIFKCRPLREDPVIANKLVFDDIGPEEWNSVKKSDLSSESLTHRLRDNPGLRAALGIDETLEDVVDETVTMEHAEDWLRNKIDNDPYGSYDKILAIQKKTTAEQSKDPTKSIRLAFEEQFRKKNGRK